MRSIREGKYAEVFIWQVEARLLKVWKKVKYKVLVQINKKAFECFFTVKYLKNVSHEIRFQETLS